MVIFMMLQLLGIIPFLTLLDSLVTLLYLIQLILPNLMHLLILILKVILHLKIIFSLLKIMPF